MHTDARARVAFGVPALAAAIWGLAVASPAATPAQTELACTAWTEDSIPVNKERLEVTAKYAEPIGDSLSAKFPDSAQIVVVSAARAPDGEPQAAKLVMNTARAVPGKWKLTITGNSGECTGEVTVGPKK